MGGKVVSQNSDRQKSVNASGPRPLAAIDDLHQGLKLWRIWLTLSWQEFRSTYRRSLVGFLWVTLSFAAFIGVKLVIFSALLKSEDANYYNAYLVVGFFIWMFLQPSISSAPEVFSSSKGWISSEPLPLSLYIYKAVMRETYNTGLTFIVVVAAFVYIGFPFSSMAIFSIPAILFLLLNAVTYKLLLGVVGARVRDIAHLVKAIMMPMMFLTPIFWMPSQMASLMKYLWWNPLYHYIEIFRAPMLGEGFPLESWIFCGLLYGIMSVSALFMFARYRQRIVFWF